MVESLWKSVPRYHKCKCIPTPCPSNITHRCLPKRKESIDAQQGWYKNIYRNFINNISNHKESPDVHQNEVDKQFVMCPYNGILHSTKKWQTTNTQTNLKNVMLSRRSQIEEYYCVISFNRSIETHTTNLWWKKCRKAFFFLPPRMPVNVKLLNEYVHVLTRACTNTTPLHNLPTDDTKADLAFSFTEMQRLYFFPLLV